MITIFHRLQTTDLS